MSVVSQRVLSPIRAWLVKAVVVNFSVRKHPEDVGIDILRREGELEVIVVK